MHWRRSALVLALTVAFSVVANAADFSDYVKTGGVLCGVTLAVLVAAP
ncbi:hypothetical protein GCM10009801_73120 [Streptomyces albiaxialis]|uniref:Uncharacterized protein n=1 Tax=Streptomyces albiaxialis TaxID=329523 RepID=A0ABN2WWU9_9ACTN